MTDRLAELRAGSAIDDFNNSMTEIDLEKGHSLDDEEDKALSEYSREADAISTAIDRIHENVEVIESRYKMAMDARVSPGDKHYASDEISRLLEQTEQTSGAIRKRLRRIAGENTVFSRECKEKTSELRIRVNTHQALTRRFMDAMQAFEESQDRHRKNVKSALQRQLRRMNPEANDEDVEDAVRRGRTNLIIDDSPTLAMMPPEEQHRLRTGLADLQSRNNDMKKLEASIVELHQLFMDMQLLVETQGDLLNNTEYNIVETKAKTGEGLRELVEAREHQKSAGKKKMFIIGLLVLIVLAITVGVLVRYGPVWFRKRSDNDNDGETPGANSTAPAPSPAEAVSSAAVDERAKLRTFLDGTSRYASRLKL